MKTIIRLSVAFLVIFVGLYVHYKTTAWSSKKIQKNITRATVIISAISDYQLKEGILPKNIDVLSPLYLDSIPKSKLGEWFYEVSLKNGRSEYVFGFDGGAEKNLPIIYYNSNTKEWYGDTR